VIGLKRVLGIIPARGGSKRIARKNLRLLGSKPLLAWAVELARAATSLKCLVVSSDDEEILDVARAHHAVMALRRPSEFATDTAPAIDYVRHALAGLEGTSGHHFDGVVILQPSSPFTLPEDVDATVRLLDESGADTAVSIVEVEHALHPAKFKVLRGDRLLPYLEDEGGRMAAHELPRVYVRNGSVYATRRRVIEQGRIIGEDCRGYLMPRERSLDINEELDLEFAAFLLERRQRRS
jgi:CMP-N-acetylneuraminic acid synthetase